MSQDATRPPDAASPWATKAYGCLLGTGMMGAFLLAGVVGILLPLPHRWEALRPPFSIATGVGSIVAIALLGGVPLLLFRAGERRRFDLLFGQLGLRGRSDPGHGAEYQGNIDGREHSASVSLDGASPVTTHTRASFGVDAATGVRLVLAKRGSPYLQVYQPTDCRHVLLAPGEPLDVRSTHPEIARAWLTDPKVRPVVNRLLAGHHDAASILTVGPDNLLLRVDGDGATRFNGAEAAARFDDLRTLAAALEQRAPDTGRLRADGSWLDLGHKGRRSLRIRQWAMSCGCLTFVALGWLGWVAAIVWTAK